MSSRYVIPFFQIPLIVGNHPDMTGNHLYVFMVLYNILKDKDQCIFSNSSLSKKTNNSIREIARILNDLETWGFISRIGEKQNRRFYLGLLLNTCAKTAVPKLNTCATLAHAYAKNDSYMCHTGIYTKINTNISSKEEISLQLFSKENRQNLLNLVPAATQRQKQIIDFLIKNPDLLPTSEERRELEELTG